MNATDIIWRLAKLASLPYQECYVMGGTADEYILDTELLENVDSLKYLIRRPENRSAATNEQLAALEDLFIYIELHSGEALGAGSQAEGAALIRESGVWKDLRAKATSALELFGVIIDNLYVDEVDQLADS